MKRSKALCGSILLILFLAGISHAEAIVSDDVPNTRFFVAPYAWMVGMKSTVGAKGYKTEVDSSFSDALDKVDFAGMLVMEAVFENKYGIMTDLNMISLKDQEAYRGITLDGGTNMFFGNASLFYRLMSRPLKSNPAGYMNLDVMAGFNYWNLDLDLRASALGGSRHLYESADWFDFIAGLRTQIRFDEKWTFVMQGRLGKGEDTHSTWDVAARIGYRIGNNSSLTLGYRAVYVNHETNNGFVFKTTMQGPVLGVVFSF